MESSILSLKPVYKKERRYLRSSQNEKNVAVQPLAASSFSSSSGATSYWSALFYNALSNDPRSYQLWYSTSNNGTGYYTPCISGETYVTFSNIPAPTATVSDSATTKLYVQITSCYTSSQYSYIVLDMQSLDVYGDGSTLILLHYDRTQSSIPQQSNKYFTSTSRANWMLLNAQYQLASGQPSRDNFVLESPTGRNETACLIQYGDSDTTTPSCAKNSSSAAIDLTNWALNLCSSANITTGTSSRTSCHRNAKFTDTSIADIGVGQTLWIIAAPTKVDYIKTGISSSSSSSQSSSSSSSNISFGPIFIVGIVFIITIFSPLLLWWALRCATYFPAIFSRRREGEGEGGNLPAVALQASEHPEQIIYAETEADVRYAPYNIDRRNIQETRTIRGGDGKLFETTATFAKPTGGDNVLLYTRGGIGAAGFQPGDFVEDGVEVVMLSEDDIDIVAPAPSAVTAPPPPAAAAVARSSDSSTGGVCRGIIVPITGIIVPNTGIIVPNTGIIVPNTGIIVPPSTGIIGAEVVRDDDADDDESKEDEQDSSEPEEVDEEDEDGGIDDGDRPSTSGTTTTNNNSFHYTSYSSAGPADYSYSMASRRGPRQITTRTAADHSRGGTTIITTAPTATATASSNNSNRRSRSRNQQYSSDTNSSNININSNHSGSRSRSSPRVGTTGLVYTGTDTGIYHTTTDVIPPSATTTAVAAGGGEEATLGSSPRERNQGTRTTTRARERGIGGNAPYSAVTPPAPPAPPTAPTAPTAPGSNFSWDASPPSSITTRNEGVQQQEEGGGNSNSSYSSNNIPANNEQPGAAASTETAATAAATAAAVAAGELFVSIINTLRSPFSG